jgi:Mce-associated membrane protein
VKVTSTSGRAAALSGARELDADRAARRELREAVDELHRIEVDAGLRRRPPRRRWVIAGLLLVVSLVLAGVAVTAWMRDRAHYSDAELQSAAADRVEVLIAPDSRDDRRAQRILAGATGAFYDEFAQSADSYTEFVRANGTVAQSSVDGTGISVRDGDSATVLVAATVVFAGKGAPDAADDQARRFRLRVLVTPDDGSLKLGAVQYLP